jgi:hypothetical protein
MARYALRAFGSPVKLPIVSIPANITLYVQGQGTPDAAKVPISSVDYFSPIFVGDVGNKLCIQVLRRDRSIVSILGSTISMKMQSLADLNIIKTCTGAWKASPANDGTAFYAYQPNDVNTAGSWRLWFEIFLDGEPLHPDDGTGNPKLLQILPLPIGV